MGLKMKMHNFSVNIDESNKYEFITVNMNVEPGLTLEKMCQAFDQFLKAIGYNFEGEVSIFDDEILPSFQDDEESEEDEDA